MQSSDVEIPFSNDLKYKTIQKLSKPSTFQGCKVTEIAAKRKARKRNYSNIVGLLDVNRTICAVHKNTPQWPNKETCHDNDKNSNNQQYKNLWVTDVSDAELLKTVNSLDLAESCYMSKEMKEALLSAINNSQTTSTTNFAQTTKKFTYLTTLHKSVYIKWQHK